MADITVMGELLRSRDADPTRCYVLGAAAIHDAAFGGEVVTVLGPGRRLLERAAKGAPSRDVGWSARDQLAYMGLFTQRAWSQENTQPEVQATHHLLSPLLEETLAAYEQEPSPVNAHYMTTIAYQALFTRRAFTSSFDATSLAYPSRPPKSYTQFSGQSGDYFKLPLHITARNGRSLYRPVHANFVARSLSTGMPEVADIPPNGPDLDNRPLILRYVTRLILREMDNPGSVLPEEREYLQATSNYYAQNAERQAT